MWCKLLSSLILFSGFLSRPWIIGAINLGFEETFEPERTILGSVVLSSYRQFNQHSITRRALQCLLDYSLSTANSILLFFLRRTLPVLHFLAWISPESSYLFCLNRSKLWTWMLFLLNLGCHDVFYLLQLLVEDESLICKAVAVVLSKKFLLDFHVQQLNGGSPHRHQ